MTLYARYVWIREWLSQRWVSPPCHHVWVPVEMRHGYAENSTLTRISTCAKCGTVVMRKAERR